MIRVAPSRARPGNRAPTGGQQPASQTRTYPAPVAGLVTNANALVQDAAQAVVLENFWPTATGVEPRGGSKARVTVPAPVTGLFEYRAGPGPYFVATATGIYQFEADTPDNTALTAVVTGQSSGDYAVLEMQTEGGSFLSIANGADPMQQYDGSSWSAAAITGVDTDKISHLWAYRNRQYLIEAGTMNAWYLGVNSIAGAATKLPMAGVFRKGGALSFGATWSSDSGAGMDDRCVFGTDQGEFAVFTGGNPGDVDDWSLVGVFDIGEPLDPRAHMNVGGDLIIATKAGLIPISAAVQKDPSQLKLAALTRNIDPDWRHAVTLSAAAAGWRLEKWDSRNMAIVAPPASGSEQGYCWAVNLETGAWTRFTGWNIGDVSVMGDLLYYGDETGTVYQCDATGTDNGSPFVCRLCHAADALDRPEALKQALIARGHYRLNTSFEPKLSVSTNYSRSFPAPPNAAADPEIAFGVWDASAWDQSAWASEARERSTLSRRQSVAGHGQTLAPQLQITSGAEFKLDCELVAIEMTYSTGGTVS